MTDVHKGKAASNLSSQKDTPSVLHVATEEEIGNATVLAKILALRPVSWRWKDKKVSGEKQYGFIAQEVEEIFPDMVSDGIWLDGKKHKFITPTDLVPYLISAIKEQQIQIDELRRIIAEKRKK